MVERDGEGGSAAAGKFLRFYLGSPTCHTHLRALGFTDADLAGDGSDRLVDALVAWGDERRLRLCLDAHLEAGANHVVISALSSAGGHRPDERALEAMAPR